jgi:3-methyladenine DNA glycosylase AlkD
VTATDAVSGAETVALTAERFLEQLHELTDPAELAKIQRYFKTGEGEYGEGDTFIGVRMGHVFNLAKGYLDMPPDEIERLLDSDIHEARAGALSTMEKQVRRKKTPDSCRRELYELYLRRHDRINNWDLVDLGCRYVIGAYLIDRPRDVLYELARSDDVWERRTAIVSTSAFIRQGDLDDAFAIAEILVDDDHDLIHKATGWMLREAGRHDEPRLLAFLDRHAATMPRTLLRSAIERLDKPQREHYRGLAR